MRNGECPKCGSHDIHVSTVTLPVKGLNSVPIKYSMLWGASMAPINYYVCTHCGYVEQYITNTAKLREIANKLPQVDPE